MLPPARVLCCDLEKASVSPCIDIFPSLFTQRSFVVISLLSLEIPTLFCKHLVSCHHEFKQETSPSQEFLLGPAQCFLIFGVALIVVSQHC